MLLMGISVVIIALIGLMSFLFSRRFTVLRINGNSMFPTLKNGQFRLMDRRIKLSEITPYNMTSYISRVYVYENPIGLPVIKRLVNVAFTGFGHYYWFEGDNPEHSEDSRHYGFVQEENIYGEMITDWKTFWKRLFTL